VQILVSLSLIISSFLLSYKYFHNTDFCKREYGIVSSKTLKSYAKVCCAKLGPCQHGVVRPRVKDREVGLQVWGGGEVALSILSMPQYVFMVLGQAQGQL
jgi:hypothetical protein